MSCAFRQVLKGQRKTPTKTAGRGPVTHAMVFDRDVVLRVVPPIRCERFGHLIHVGLFGDLRTKLRIYDSE